MPSILENLTSAVVDAITSALDGTSTLPALRPPDPAGTHAALADLPARAREVTEVGDAAAWPAAVRRWRDRLDDLADAAFGGPDALDALLVRLLDEHLPRTAAYLTLARVIRRNPGAAPMIDADRAAAVLRDPGTAVDEELWDALLGDTGAPGTGRLPAVLVALLILAPQSVVALAAGDLTVAPLAAPVTDGPGVWRTFRENTQGWISVTVPFGDPAAPQPYPSSILDFAADLLPDLSATLALRSDRVPDPGGGRRTVFEAWLALAVATDRWQYDLGSGWFVRVEPGITAGFGYDGEWHGAFRQFPTGTVEPPTGADPVVVSLGRELPDGAPDLAFGPPYDTRLVAKDLGFFVHVREDHPVVEIGAFLHGFSLVLTNRWWRTFGISDTLFGAGIRFDLDLDIAYVEGVGLRLGLGAGLDVRFDLDATLGKRSGPVSFTVHSVRLTVPLAVTQDSLDVRAEVRFHLSLTLGPAVLVVDGLGGWVGYWTVDGEKDYVGVLPPTGAGLQISAGPFTGGGFLDFTGGPNERFGGLVSVRVGTVTVTAFGLHELTGAPGTPNRARSLVMVLGIRFSPGIQLGFGIEISGFGGLIGINRTVDTDALRERLTSGAAGNVLFAEDPVRNAPALLGDLAALFPASDGTHVFGPTLQLAWLNVAGYTFLRVDLGVFLEFPGPRKVVLFGSARAQLPPVGNVPKLLDLRLDLVGFLDLPGRRVEIDATLISSHALYVFHLTGDAAFRLHWGSPAYLVLFVGGFHPRYHPEPAVVPDLTRLALTYDNPVPGLFFRAEAYLAVTSNTVQFGGRIEVGYKAGKLNLVGFLNLDAIVQFSPFWFEASVSAGVRLRWGSTTLAGVRLEGLISGPGPFRVVGKACFEILWFDICAEVSIELGPSAADPPPPVGSVVQALRPEVHDPANLEPVDGDDPHVVTAPRSAPAAAPPVSPVGALRWRQRRVPLDVPLDRMEGNPLAGRQCVVVECPQRREPAVDDFAPGSFTNLTEAESLNRPAFERLPSGFVAGFGHRSAVAVPHTVEVVEIRLPRPDRFLLAALEFPVLLLAAVGDRTAPAAVRSTAPRVRVRDETFAVRFADGSPAATDSSVTGAHQLAAGIAGAVALPALDLVDVGGW